MRRLQRLQGLRVECHVCSGLTDRAPLTMATVRDDGRKEGRRPVCHGANECRRAGPPSLRASDYQQSWAGDQACRHFASLRGPDRNGRAFCPAAQRQERLAAGLQKEVAWQIVSRAGE